MTDLPLETSPTHEITINSEEVSVTTVSPELEDLLDKPLEIKSPATSAKKYGLQGLETEPDNKNNEEEKKGGTVREKPYISKAKRRKIKKGQCQGESQTHSEVSRGQKGKLKKMKQKYADEDEEERKIRMGLLASAENGEVIEPEPQIEEITTNKELKPLEGIEDAPKRCYKCKKVGHVMKETVESI